MSATIIVTAAVPGFHYWPRAPLGVAFLGERHRHVFHLRVEIPVRHDDRDVEFFHAQHALAMAVEDLFPRLEPGLGHEFGANSCEAIARRLLAALPVATACEVWEDGENGARVVVEGAP